MPQQDTTIQPRVTNFTRKVQPLNLNEKKELQGEATLAISPFDDYFMFTLFKEEDGEDIAMDLTTSGTIFLNFLSNDDEIKIRNRTDIEGIDPKQGQVIFKITKEQSKKILSFTDNNFFISTKVQVGEDESDETVLYVGKFFAFDKLPEKTLRKEFEEAKVEGQKIIDEQKVEIRKLTAENNDLTVRITELAASVQRLQDLNNQLIDVKRVEDVEDKRIIEALEKENARTQQALQFTKDILKSVSVNQKKSRKELENVLKIANLRNLQSFRSGDNTRFQIKFPRFDRLRLLGGS